MSILIFALVVLLVAALLVYAVRQFPLDAPFGNLIAAIILVIAALAIAAGIF